MSLQVSREKELYDALGRITRDAEAVHNSIKEGNPVGVEIEWASIQVARRVLNKYAYDLGAVCGECGRQYD